MIGKGVLSNVARGLASKGITLGLKSTSIINAFSTASGFNTSALAEELGDKIIAELGFYRNVINPMVTSIFESINSSLKVYNIASSVNEYVSEYELPSIVKALASGGVIDDKTTSLSPSTLRATLIPNIDVAAMDSETLQKAFKDGAQVIPELNMIEEILVKYTDEELKSIISTYFSMFIADDTKEVNGKINYKTLAYTSAEAFGHINIALLGLAYVASLQVNPPVTNLPVQEASEALGIILNDFKKMVSLGYTYYVTSLGMGMLAYRKPGDEFILVFKETYASFAEQAKVDAWAAVSALQPRILNKVTSDFGPFTVENVLVHEDKLVEAYNAQLTLDQLTIQNEYISNVKRSIVNEVCSLWDNSFEGNDLVGYSLVKNRDELIEKINTLLSTNPDAYVSNSYGLAVDIVGGILFGKTSFKNFYNDTKIVTEDGISSLNLSQDSAITVAAASLLARFLVDSLEQA